MVFQKSHNQWEPCYSLGHPAIPLNKKDNHFPTEKVAEASLLPTSHPFPFSIYLYPLA